MMTDEISEFLEKHKESVELNTDFSYLESYWRKGGTYELPVELVNDLTGRIEELVAEVKELKREVNKYKKLLEIKDREKKEGRL